MQTLVILSSLTSCADPVMDGPISASPTPVGTGAAAVTAPDTHGTRVVGQVRGLHGAIATVDVCGVHGETDSEGFFLLTDPSIAACDRLVARADGYLHRVAHLPDGQDRQVYVQLPALVASEIVTGPSRIDLDEHGSIDLTQVRFTSADGRAVHDKVRMNVAVVNAAKDLDAAPGNMRTDAGKPLQSYGMLGVSFETEGGEPVTFAGAASLTLRAPGLQAGDTPGLWHVPHDGKAWTREGEWTVDDDGFAHADVSHFSWWNIDTVAEAWGCLSGQIVDDKGEGVGSVMVRATSSESMRQVRGMTDDQGRFCTQAPPGVVTVSAMIAKGDRVLAWPAEVPVSDDKLDVCGDACAANLGKLRPETVPSRCVELISSEKAGYVVFLNADGDGLPANVLAPEGNQRHRVQLPTSVERIWEDGEVREFQDTLRHIPKALGGKVRCEPIPYQRMDLVVGRAPSDLASKKVIVLPMRMTQSLSEFNSLTVPDGSSSEPSLLSPRNMLSPGDTFRPLDLATRLPRQPSFASKTCDADRDIPPPPVQVHNLRVTGPLGQDEVLRELRYHQGWLAQCVVSDGEQPRPAEIVYSVDLEGTIRDVLVQPRIHPAANCTNTLRKCVRFRGTFDLETEVRFTLPAAGPEE